MASAVIVGLSHGVVIWMLAANIHVRPTGRPAAELSVTVFNASPQVSHPALTPLPSPKFESPATESITEPQITIEPSGPAQASDGIALVVPPRPDVSKRHDLPELPLSLRQRIRISPPTLRILVLPDGGIGEAEIVKSSGDKTLDFLAASFVRENWRYLPAEAAGRPVEDWITVIVHFAS